MHIVQLLPELDEGGVERGTAEISRELVKRGHQSTAISVGGRLVSQIESEGGRHVTLPIAGKNPLTAPARVWALRQAFRELKPDMLHARSRVPAWLTRLARRPLRIPWVTTVHGLNRINAYSRIMTAGDRVIAVGEAVKAHVVDGYRLAPDSVRVIQRGVDMQAFSDASLDLEFIQRIRGQYNLAKSLVVVAVGRVTFLKDYESLIEAAAQLRNQAHRPLKVLIAGGAHPNKQDYFQSLLTLVESKSLGGSVHFIGSQTKVAELYHLADVSVNVSLKMGNMGRTVVESLAMGTPVVATTYPGLKNLVSDGLNGAVIETKNPDALTRALEQVGEGDWSREAIRGTVPHEYTLDGMVDQLVEVYQSLAASSSA